MESPSDDFDRQTDYDAESTEPSEPASPLEPYRPKYNVKIIDPVKDGEVVQYTVKSTRLSEKEEEFTVVRQYEDFEWLHHLIITQGDVSGLIVPPLPIKPVVEPKSVETKTKKQLGSAKFLIGDEFHKDCRALEKYLKLLLQHPILGLNGQLEKFLKDPAPLTRAKVTKGLLGGLTSAIGAARKSNVKDIDDFFQKDRDYANEYGNAIKEASQNFNKMVFCQQKIASAYGHLSTALIMGTNQQDEQSIKINKLFITFSEALEDAKQGVDVDVANDENTLGFHLDLTARYAESVKEMLYHRTCLMIDYQEANKALTKVKPQKKAAAEETRMEAEKAFEECSEVARRELMQHQRQRVIAFQDALTLYTDAKIKTARDTYALLAKSLRELKEEA